MCTPFCKSLCWFIRWSIRLSITFLQSFTIWSTLCSNPIFFYPPLPQFDQHFVQTPFLSFLSVTIWSTLHSSPISFSIFFLACTQLYKPLCWLVSQLVGLSVCGWRLGACNLWRLALLQFNLFYMHFPQKWFKYQNVYFICKENSNCHNMGLIAHL